MYKVDLNSDLGESFGAYKIGMDEAVIAHVSSANVACGFHAGDPLVMEKTVAACRAAAQGVELQHVKPHGALYNMAAKDFDLALAIAQGVAAAAPKAILLGLAGSKLLEAGRQAGLRVASEVFADRAYQADGSLVPRSQPGAVIHDREEAISRTLHMVTRGTATAITGEEVSIDAHSICIHGDNPSAVEFVQAIRARLEGEGVAVAPISQIV